MESVPPPDTSRPSPTQSQGRMLKLLTYGLTKRDVDQVRTLFPDGQLAVAHVVKKKVYAEGKRVDAKVFGVGPDYFDLIRTTVIEGRGICALDNRDGSRVAVIAEPLTYRLRKLGGTRGLRLRVGDEYMEVVGVVRMPARVAANAVFIPYRAAQRLYGTTTLKGEAGQAEFTKTEVGQLVLKLPDENMIPPASRLLQRMIGESHAAPDVDFTIPLDLLASKQRTQRILNLVLVAIAAISLLVGGIGIMNIMLTVVAERIPEIGVRRAIGASRRDVMWQFLVETVALCTAGGVLGCVAGIASVPLASRWTGWSGVVTPGAVGVSLAVSWLVGMVFGLAPALRAAHLDPVECLRHE